MSPRRKAVLVAHASRVSVGIGSSRPVRARFVLISPSPDIGVVTDPATSTGDRCWELPLDWGENKADSESMLFPAANVACVSTVESVFPRVRTRLGSRILRTLGVAVTSGGGGLRIGLLPLSPRSLADDAVAAVQSTGVTRRSLIQSASTLAGPAEVARSSRPRPIVPRSGHGGDPPFVPLGGAVL